MISNIYCIFYFLVLQNILFPFDPLVHKHMMTNDEPLTRGAKSLVKSRLMHYQIAQKVKIGTNDDGWWMIGLA